MPRTVCVSFGRSLVDLQFRFDVFDLSGEAIVALFIAGLLILLSFIVFILAKKTDPLARPKGLLLLVEWAIEKIDGFVEGNMGEGFDDFGGYLLGLIPYLFLCFTIGIVGLPTPMTNLAVPLSLALCTFILIHATSVRFTKWRYFKRYIDPLPIFLPINLISMWAPLLSLTLRLFGNALVGYVLLTLLNGALESLSALIFTFVAEGWNTIFLVPIATPLLHAYFDLFSGFIQTLVFISLTASFIAQERPEADEADERVVALQEKEVMT